MNNHAFEINFDNRVVYERDLRTAEDTFARSSNNYEMSQRGEHSMADEEEKKRDSKMTVVRTRKAVVGKKTPDTSTPQQPAAKDIPEGKSTHIPDIVDPAKARNEALAAKGSAEKQADLDSKPEGSNNLSSDTVVLKVVKDKKKKLAGILSKSQTIRLRAPGTATPAADIETPKAPAAPRGVLKIKPEPGAGSAKAAPITLQRPAIKVKSTTKTEDQDVIAKTTTTAGKIPDSNKVPAPTDASGAAGKVAEPSEQGPKATLKMKVPAPVAAPVAEENVAEPPKQSPKATIKMKLPVGRPGGAKSKSTLKIKSPVVGAKPARSGKSLKLKAVPRPQPQPGQAQPAADAVKKPLKLGAVKKSKQTADAGTEPDIVYFISAVASLIAVGVTAAMLISQYHSLF